MRRDMGMQDATGRMFQQHKHGEQTQGCRDHDTEVARHNGLDMVAHKGPPALRLHAFPWTPLPMCSGLIN